MDRATQALTSLRRGFVDVGFVGRSGKSAYGRQLVEAAARSGVLLGHGEFCLVTAK